MTSMDTYLLAIYDISGIQEYIFASDRLKESVGASRIIGELLRTQLTDVLKEKNAVKVDWQDNSGFELFSDKAMRAEVIFIGGGNALVMYRDHSLYGEVNKELAIQLIEKSYTLTFVTESIVFTSDEHRSYFDLYYELQQKLAHAKESLIRPKPFGAMPISAQEHFGGFPITNKDGRSTLQALKVKAGQGKEVQEVIKPPSDKKWAIEIDDLKKVKGEDSYIAVIHIDGNGMGEQLRNNLKTANTLSFTEQVKAHRRLSAEISSGYRKLIEAVLQTIDFAEKIMPIRPLIMDGDDLTFLCQGDWALPLVTKLLQKMEESGSSLSLSACAGIAYVHGNFPFHIAYEIAEVCCKEAKKKRRINGAEGSYVDFEVVRGSDMTERKINRSSIIDGRQRPYKVSGREEDGSIQKLIDCITMLKAEKDRPAGSFARSKQNLMYQAYIKGNEAAKNVEALLSSRGFNQFDQLKPLWLDAFELADYYKQDLFKGDKVSE